MWLVNFIIVAYCADSVKMSEMFDDLRHAGGMNKYPTPTHTHTRIALQLCPQIHHRIRHHRTSLRSPNCRSVTNNQQYGGAQSRALCLRSFPRWVTSPSQVHVYILILSPGLARQMSLQLLGIQIDAVYHTSIVVFGREYYYGSGIQSSLPGRTHHGSPMEIIPLGTTSLPQDVVLEYLESMKLEYTPESYDLFLHNCNNFTADLAMFLCGVGIPEKIKNLPREVLNTPFGQMMRPALERQLRPITQAAPTSLPQSQRAVAQSKVRTVTSVSEFEGIVESASCVVAFFTSATCPPCRVVYPHFEQLAADTGEKGVFVKVDVGVAGQLGRRYEIAATPTFITWSRGEKLDVWQGASPGDLKRNVDMLMAVTYPGTYCSVAAYGQDTTDIYSTPTHKPLDPDHPLTRQYLHPQPGSLQQTPPPGESSQQAWLHRLRPSSEFINRLPPTPGLRGRRQRPHSRPATVGLVPSKILCHAPRGDLVSAGGSIPGLSGGPKSVRMVRGGERCTPPHHPLYPRILTPADHATTKTLLTHATTHHDAPYSLKLVTTQSLCNLFTSPLFPRYLATPPLSTLIISLITSFLLDTSHSTLRVAAGNLAFLLASYVQGSRSTRSEEVLTEEELVELAAALIEGLKRDDEGEGRLLALSLAMLLYCAPMEGVRDVVVALRAEEVLGARKNGAKGENGRLFAELEKLVGA